MRLLLWWLLLTALGSTLAPFLTRLFPGFPDRGAPFARPIAVALLGFGAWLLGSFGLPYGAALFGTLMLLVLGGAFALRRFGRPAIPRGELVRAEATFAAAYLFFAGVRALRPEIFGAEKYMDFAFFNALLRTAEIPPEDPWLAGAPINYYYFGYLLFANLARISSLAPEVAYNLSLATIGAVLFSGAASIGRALSGRFVLGLLGGLAAAVLGNLDGARQILIERRGLSNLDYWQSSRIVPNTINEFPFFSLLHGDLHPHVTVLLLEIPLVALLLSATWQRRGPLARAPASLAVVFFAAVAVTNPWDLPLVFALLGLLCLRRTWSLEAPLRSLAPVAGTIAATAIGVFILALPFVRQFSAPLGGVGRVHAQTTIAEAFLVFGILVLPIGLAIAARTLDLVPATSERRSLLLAASAFVAAVLAIAGKSVVLAAMALLLGGSVFVCLADLERRSAGAALVALGAAAVAACEVVYLRDPYGTDLHRMNTVFKLYYQAWLYWALAWPAMLSIASERFADRGGRRAAAGAVAVLVLAGLCYPAAAIVTFAGSTPRPIGLDGLAYLDRDHPDDARAIRWLRVHTSGRPRILEATGDAYSYFARVSTNTGLPTLLGWANHEGVWRGADARIAERAALIRRLYEDPAVDIAANLLARHGVRYVFVGELERKTYSAAGIAKFTERPTRFASVFRSGETVVYELLKTTAAPP